MLHWRFVAFATVLSSFAASIPLGQDEQNTSIAFVSTNLAKGNGNWFTYERFSGQQLKIADGDILVYSVFLDVKNPLAKGAVDVDFSDSGDSLRDLGLSDQNGVRVHGDGVLDQAVGKWYTRRIDLSSCKGRTAISWNLALEGDKDGKYAMFLDDVYVEHRDATRTSVYADGAVPAKALILAEGYSKYPTLLTVKRSEVGDPELIARIDKDAERLRVLEKAKDDIALAKKFLERNPDPALEGHVKEAEAMIAQVERRDATPDQITAALHAAEHALSHTHPVMEKYTGHLVGHAHIDLQWLWEWQEGIVFSRDTFNQAAKFMEEYPGFTFSQSSSAIYQTIEEHYPDLFKVIQQKVKKGQWELVGGRVCEGDENMISAESSARHFLYGQRYFREKFGKMATVGWEPDTFGHTIQMPQILKLGGCKYFYFCRGGKGKPLFWWEGLDGTKVLAFDEPATGSWYNSDLSYQQFQEMLDFEKTSSGSKDSLMVYGVGNHGGGPTREMIETALSWMKDPTKPKVKFSTATQFFKKLESYDLTKIPVVNEELNPVFDGCYTTHSEVKQLNRQAEAMTTSAEAVATVASLQGFDYPKVAFRRNWEDICFNHHHDTLPGSGIHAPYEKTKTSLGRVIADDKDIITRALETLAIRVTPPKGGVNMLVFNPTGWKRSGWVETYLVKSGWDQENALDPAHTVAVAPDGSKNPVVLLDKPSRKVRFWAADIPSYGYRVFHLGDGDWTKPAMETRDDGFTVDTARWTVEFNRADGDIKRLYDKQSKREYVSPGGGLGRLETHWENPGGMSAWVIGKIAGVDTVKPVGASSVQGPDYTEVSFSYSIPAVNASQPSTVVQRFRVWANGDIKVKVDCDWQAIGTGQTKNPMLRVAFDTPWPTPKATYQVPFGAIIRPVDGREMPALQWVDLSSGKLGRTPGPDTAYDLRTYGLSVINDSKHGYSASGNTLRLSLIRSSYDPDPDPNPGTHHWEYQIAAHEGNWSDARITQKAAELNQPLLAASVPFDARGTAPLEYSPVSIDDPKIIPTALKRGEDKGNSIILRFYRGTGVAQQGSIDWNIPFRSAEWVNFLEDRLQTAPSSAKIPFDLHPWEIKTVKINLR